MAATRSPSGSPRTSPDQRRRAASRTALAADTLVFSSVALTIAHFSVRTAPTAACSSSVMAVAVADSGGKLDRGGQQLAQAGLHVAQRHEVVLAVVVGGHVCAPTTVQVTVAPVATVAM
jgi:hypothetical protein